MSTISPELALVDPELAAAARALLPGPGEFRPGWRSSAGSGPSISVASPVSVARAPRLARGTRLVAGASLLAAAVGVLVLWGPDAPPQPAAVASQVSRPVQAERQSRAARTHTWPAVAGAHGYRVEIRAGARLLFERTTEKPVLELPASLKFSPGRHTLSVTPQVAGSSDPVPRPVLEETFLVGSP